MRHRSTRFLLFCLCVLLAAVLLAAASDDQKYIRDRPRADRSTTNVPAQMTRTAGDRTGEKVNWQVLSAGGSMSVSNGSFLGSTVGQTATGVSVSGEQLFHHGFWQNFESSESCCVIRGDVNGVDGGPDISDLVYLVDYVFLFGPPPPCMAEADINGDGEGPDISDLVYLVDYIFLSGPPPVPCP